MGSRVGLVSQQFAHRLNSNPFIVALSASVFANHPLPGRSKSRRLLSVQLFGHKHPEIAKKVDIAATTIFDGTAVEP
jgi:hypothetical protein